jgi:putative ABC transport system permease protein
MLAVLTSTDHRMAFWFICGAAICFGIFRYAAAVVVKLTRHLPRPDHPSLRLGLANIHRRGSPAGNAIFSLGLGLTALVVIMLVQTNLDDKVNETVPSEAPAFFFLDIQSHQAERFEATAQKLPGIRKIERYPTLRGRITAIAGTPVGQAKVAQEVRWNLEKDLLMAAAPVRPSSVKQRLSSSQHEVLGQQKHKSSAPSSLSRWPLSRQAGRTRRYRHCTKSIHSSSRPKMCCTRV